MSPRNHSNFPGALWRTDNSLRGVPFLFFTPPSFPPSHLLSLTPSLPGSLLDARILQDFPWLYLPPFCACVTACVCAAKFEAQSNERRHQTTVALICTSLSVRAAWASLSRWTTLFPCIARAALRRRGAKCAPKAPSQPVILLSTFQRLCCQTMVLPPRPLALRICNA